MPDVFGRYRFSSEAMVNQIRLSKKMHKLPLLFQNMLKTLCSQQLHETLTDIFRDHYSCLRRSSTYTTCLDTCGYVCVRRRSTVLAGNERSPPTNNQDSRNNRFSPIKRGMSIQQVEISNLEYKVAFQPFQQNIPSPFSRGRAVTH